MSTPRSWSFALLLVLLVLSAMGGAHAAEPPTGAVAEAQLRAINHRFVEAFATRDAGFMDALTARDFRRTSARGAWMDRTEHVDSIRTSTAQHVSYDDVRVRLFGPVALVHAVFNAIGAEGAPVRARYTDVYHWDGAQWRLVSGQNTVLGAGAEVAQRRIEAPVHGPWLGKDPQGDDLEVLRQLNENYVDAFRRADVAWYGAHLAPDYVVVNPDGSFGDRGAALAAFAEPVFATKLATFPVDHVTIRRFADVAVIHAENAYTRKDGSKAAARYTDIWHKRDGRWVCIAAHITPVKPAG